ncbi:nitroreductase family protein, partial [Patescibacteria group bacterium]|nr:nitroreductase family protein [Patescibacteria group bacterium]
MKILPVIKKRRSVRQYTEQMVEKEKIEAILRSAMSSPSAKHERRWEFVVVDDQAKIKQLAAMKTYSAHVAQAPVVIVLCSEDWDYWLEDASIVGMAIYLEANNQGLGTCWTQVRGGECATSGGDSEAYVRQILGIPEEMRVLC